MPVRVSPTDRIRRHIDDLFAEDKPLPEILEDVARLGAQLLMQAALEAEVTEFLGRDRYARAATAEDARPGSRNGYREVTVKTTAGPVALARPKLRGTTEAFASRLFGSHVTKTNALESLVIASFIRGLSVRDVEATLAEALSSYGGQVAFPARRYTTPPSGGIEGFAEAVAAESAYPGSIRVSVLGIVIRISVALTYTGSPGEGGCGNGLDQLDRRRCTRRAPSLPKHCRVPGAEVEDR